MVKVALGAFMIKINIVVISTEVEKSFLICGDMTSSLLNS